MNFLQTYRRHLIFKLAGIAAVILAVLSSAYLFMSADYAPDTPCAQMMRLCYPVESQDRLLNLVFHAFGQ